MDTERTLADVGEPNRGECMIAGMVVGIVIGVFALAGFLIWKLSDVFLR